MTRPLPRAAAAAAGKPKPKPKRGEPRSRSHQKGLPPESKGPPSGYPRRRPSLGRWRLNHNSHTPKPKPKPQSKNPQPPSDLKLSARGASQVANRMRMWLHVLERTSSQSLFSSWPVLSKKVWIASSTTERIKFRTHFPQVLQRNTLVAAGPSSQKGRNLHVKMYLKSKSKIVLSFNTPISSLFTLLLHRNEAT